MADFLARLAEAKSEVDGDVLPLLAAMRSRTAARDGSSGPAFRGPSAATDAPSQWCGELSQPPATAAASVEDTAAMPPRARAAKGVGASPSFCGGGGSSLLPSLLPGIVPLGANGSSALPPLLPLDGAGTGGGTRSQTAPLNATDATLALLRPCRSFFLASPFRVRSLANATATAAATAATAATATAAPPLSPPPPPPPPPLPPPPPPTPYPLLHHFEALLPETDAVRARRFLVSYEATAAEAAEADSGAALAAAMPQCARQQQQQQRVAPFRVAEQSVDGGASMSAGGLFEDEGGTEEEVEEEEEEEGEEEEAGGADGICAAGPREQARAMAARALPLRLAGRCGVGRESGV